MGNNLKEMCPGHRINRREFMRGAAGVSMLSLLPTCARTAKTAEAAAGQGTEETREPPLRKLPGYRPRVASAWVPGEDAGAFYRSLKSTVEAATDFSWLSRGDRVLLKLAMNSGNVYPATTDPWLLAYMVHILKEKGAGEILVGDQSGVETVLWTPDTKRGSSRAHCETTGLMKVIRDTGAKPCFFEEAGYDAYEPALPAGPTHWTQPIWVTKAVDDVDHIVYLARVSSHVLGDITSGMKLGVGFLRDDSRRLFHQGGRDFYAMYEEISQVPAIRSKLRLSVSSGRKVLSTFGPDNGHVSSPELGLLIASEDLLAHELLSYAWLKWNRQFETSSLSRGTTGKITKFRSQINQAFVRFLWDSKPERETPGLPFWEAGDIYRHPSILNCMKRMGGRPDGIDWERIQSGPAGAPNEYLANQIAT